MAKPVQKRAGQLTVRERSALLAARSTRNIAIVTKHAHFHGGVEYVNRMLVGLLEGEGYQTSIISQDLLGDDLSLKILKRLFGLPRLLARHFNSHYRSSTDIVICNGEFSCGVQHPAAVNSFHGCYYGYANAMRPYVPTREYRGLMRLAEQQKRGAVGKHVIADSRSLAGVLEEQGVQVDEVIDNAIDTELFKPMPQFARNDRCIFVGSPDYFGKGFDMLEKLADLGVRVDCVTSTRPRDTRLGWLGNIPNEELPARYAQYKALLLPSRFEGCGLVALEAMACGTPIVMTAVGAGPDIAREIPEFVVGGPWEAVPARIAERLIAMENDYSALSVKAREYVVRHHSYADWRLKWLALIDLLLMRGGR